MGPLVLAVALSASPPCFVPADTRPGWKQVTLPIDARFLAAPEGVEQFRTGDPVEVADDHPYVYLGGWSHHGGRTHFELTPPVGACTVEIWFKERLRGAKVDVSAWGASGTMTLIDEERVAGDTLRVTWGDTGVRSVTVVVHDHMREAPIIQSWKSTCRVDSAKLPVSEAFQLGHSLYYLQTEDRVTPLCNKADVPMRVRSASLPKGTLPSSVTVRRD